MKLAVLISTLIVFIFSTFSTARATPVVTEGNVAVADTVKAKKERVKKKPSQTKRQSKTKQTDSDDAVYASEPEGETSFFGACLGSLCGSALGSTSNSTGSDAGDYEVESHISAADAYAYENDTYPTNYLGIIEPVDPAKNGVELWDKPGGYAADGFILANLGRGAEVTVIRFHYYNITQWALVRTNEPESIEGWILEREVALLPELRAEGRIQEEQVEYPTNLYEPVASTVSPDYVMGRPRFIILAEFGIPVFTNKSIREEYQNPDTTKHAYRFGAKAGLFVSETVSIAFSFGYLHANGVPLYDYEAPGLVDSPQDSKLRIWSYGLQFGQLFIFGKAGYFSYGIAPTAFKVNESARIMEYENDIIMGVRTEELTKWKVGGDINVEIGFIAARKVPIGFNVRYSLIPWKSDMDKSLTLDYLDSSSISIFSFSVSVGYLLF